MTRLQTKILQFMDAGSGFGADGKKASTKNKINKATDTMLIGRPHFPRLNFDLGNGAPVIRRHTIHPMEHM